CSYDRCLEFTNNLPPQILYQHEQFMFNSSETPQTQAVSHNNLDIVPHINQPQHQLSYLNNQQSHQQSHPVNMPHTQPVISQQQLIHLANMTHTQPVINQQSCLPIQSHIINSPIANQVQYQQPSSQPPPSPVQANIHINNHQQLPFTDQPVQDKNCICQVVQNCSCLVCIFLYKHHHHEQQEQ
ncbi:7590_t:CDS:1, partial [Racocetra persica]